MLLLFANLLWPLLALLAYLVVKFTLAASEVQQKAWIRVRPVLQPTLAEQIPLPEREILGHSAHAFARLGFNPVANGHCPDFGAISKWTQALFVNPATGQRASVIVARDPQVVGLTVAFATECPGRPQMTTEYRFRGKVTEAPPAGLLPDVAELYARHCAAVAKEGLPDHPRIVPDSANAMEWLNGRAALVAGEIAKSRRLVDDGEFYRYTWFSAGCVVWPTMWPLKPIARLLRKFRKPSPRPGTPPPI